MPSRRCCGRCLKRLVQLWAALLLLGMVLAELYHATLLWRAQGHLASAAATLGQGEGLRKNIESVGHYRDALSLYDFAHATDIGSSTGITKVTAAETVAAAVLRLLRVPGLLARSQLGVAVNGEWPAVRMGLVKHAGLLRDDGGTGGTSN